MYKLPKANNADAKHSLSVTDNKGRTLTKEQQEYFKDSKVRDDNGNLITVYHGTNSQFNEYTNIKTEPGYWLTESKEYASEHGKIIKEQYLNLTNPIDDVDTMWDIAKDYFGKDVEEKDILSNKFKEHLKSLGYDGMVWEHSGSNTYIAFDSNQIKNIDNTNPTSNPNILKEEYIQLSIEGFNREPENNLAKNNWVKYQETKKKTNEVLKREGTKVEVEKRKFSKDFVDNGYIDLNGKTINDATDVADMAQIFRNPKYETFRVIYMKGNTIVGQEAVSSKTPNETMIYTEKSMARGLYKINNRMERLGADGYYLLHNHPTGVAKASDADINTTKIISKKINGFLGHVIINSGTYALIENSKVQGFKDTLIWNDNIKIENYSEDFIDKMMSKDLWANTQITGKYDILNLAYDLKNNPNYSSLIMTDAQQKPRIILDIPNKFLNMKLGQINGYIRNIARQNGATNAYIATQNSDIFEKMNFSNALRDCILYSVTENGTLFAEQAKTGKTPGRTIFQSYSPMALRANEKIEDIYNAIFKTDNQKKSTYNVAPTAKNNVAPSVDNNVASVAENSKQNNDLKKKYTRKEVRNRLFNEMQISPEDLNIGDDIKSPNYQITDPVRVNEKVFGKELGDKINNATINKTKHNTAEKIRWQNKERQEIKDLGIKARSKESSAVQKYGEKQWVTEDGQILKYGDIELAKEFPNIDTQNKIKKAAQVIREKYDSYIEQINEVLTELGYDAIPKRTDYMRHFHELGDIFSKTGVPFNLNDMSVEDLPTDINGLTEFNKPGKNWFASSQKRYGNKTTYDAITGIDGYLEGAGNLIFHTEDIQNYRALSEAIRNQFGQTKGFDNLEGLTDEQRQQRIKDIQNNKLSKYVAWLDEQANSLAGKKGSIDRGFERVLGRKGYTLLNTVKKQVGSNMTGFNVRSSLTNFISSTIAAAKTNKIALAKGTVSTINNMFHNDGFVEKSDFLTSRFGSDSLSAKTWQKISNAGQIFMTGSDYFTSNLIARSKYFEGLQRGMSEQEALNYSNDFSSKVMGDRSQGAMPEAFNSKTLGLFTQFQLEVNNQWQHMIHDTKMDYQQNVKDKGGLKAGATVLFQMGQLAAYSYFFNELFENLTGSRAAFDPIEIFKTLFGLDDEDEEKTFDQRISETGELLVDNIPFGNLITGGGRIPIADAFEGIGTLGKKITNQKNQYGGDISWKDVGKDLLGSLPYWISPTGYSQANKTVQGIKTVANNGDYKTNSKGEKELRFPVESKNAGTYIKAGLFGKYSLPTAKDYVKRDYKKLSANQTKTFEESGLTYKQYLNYADADLENKNEKIDYINKQEWTYKQKWNIYKKDILSSTKRKDGSSQLSDAEYIVSHGVSKTKFMELYNKAYKNGIDMPTQQEYKELQKKGITLERYIYDKIYKR
jgi:hypothetical protein